MRLRSVAWLIAWVAVACATPRDFAKPVAPADATASVRPKPAAPIEPGATPPTTGVAPSGSGAEAVHPAPGASEAEPPASDSLSELGAAAFSGDVTKVEALLARGADVNQRERDGATALVLALENYHEEPKCCEHAEPRRLAQISERAHRKLRIARMLIERGADATRADRLDLTPLHHAVMSYGPEQEVIAIMELLIAHGADVNHRTRPYGRSPLEWAIGRSPERVACLLRHGADPSIVTHEGKTLLQLAQASGDASTVDQIEGALAARMRK